jgi:hypothetical protein
MSKTMSLAVCVSPIRVSDVVSLGSLAEAMGKPLAPSNDIFRVRADFDAATVPAASDLPLLPVPHMYSA